MKQVNLRIYRTILPLLLGLFLSVGVYAQNITVRGHVKDALGAVIGANVVEKGNTANGTITDLDGNFTLSVPKGATLVVSFIGYKTQEVTAASSVVVTLQDDAELLNEVVVIGYGTVKKNDATGSVTAIKPDKLNKGLTTNAQDMMTGKIAGVSVISDGGTPGGSATIRVRGGSSLSAENDPLIVIDGLAMDNNGVKGLSNPLSMVNPNDIESFTVLKDASATAIYGSRASNGVIIITTKKGQAGSKPRVSYDGNVSLSNVKKTLDVMDGDEFRAFVEEIWEGKDNDAYRKLGTANTDWQDEIYRLAVSTDHNLTISGGLKNMPYRVSFGYTNQNGVVKTSNFERYTASVNIAPSFLQDHLKVNANLKGMYAKNRYADGSVIGTAASYDPTQPVYSDNEIHQKYFGGYSQWYISAFDDKGKNTLNDSEWNYYKNSQAAYNPVASLNQKDDRATSKALVGNLELDYKVHGLEDLRLHVSGGMDLSTGKQETSWSPYSAQNNYYGNTGFDETDKYNLSLNMYAQYSKDFNEKHHFDVMGGYEWQHFHKETDYYYYGTYPDTNKEHPGEIKDPSENTLYKTENYLVSFFGRLNYSLMDRYLLTVTLRNDGSSRFHKDNRWGLFPSVAAAWKINEEAFLKDSKVVSDLKLRLGWGKTGQQEGIGDYTYFASYTTNGLGAYYPIVGNGMTYRPDAYNAALTWEKTTTYNAGIDLSLLNDRFTVNLDYYYRKTTDLINTVAVAAGSNFKNKVTSNIGELHNQGVELSFTYRPIQTKDWRWELGYNITYNDNKIDKLLASDDADYKILHGGLAVGDSGSDGIKAWAVGHPVSAFYTYQQVYDQNGQPIEGQFVDRNGDGTINSADRYFYKKADADVIMGMTSKLVYKNWDFGFSLRASLGNYAYNGVEAGRSNISVERLFNGNTWHNVTNMAMAKDWSYISTEDALSDYFIQNASFLKCDNITLGYSFEKLFGMKISGRAYLTAQNVFTISKYKGIDPEINGGYDGNIYPRPFTGVFGVSLNF